MGHIIRLIIFILARHGRESTRVHHKDSLTYHIATFTSWLWDKIVELVTQKDHVDYNWFNSIKSWWTENRWKTKSFLVKNVFTFANDGWKFWSWIMVYSASYEFAFGITRYYNLPIQYEWMWGWFTLTWIYALVLLFVGGLYHSLMDGSLLKFKK